jgi:predicted nucleic acid-binding protein
MTDLIIADSTCLIGLERIDKIDLLPQMYSQVIIPPQVQKEFGLSFAWLIVKNPQNIGMINSLKLMVDDGESEAIALAYELGFRLVVDDKQARNIAKRLDIEIIGTVGILVKAKQLWLIDQLLTILEALENKGFYLSQSLKTEALILVGET